MAEKKSPCEECSMKQTCILYSGGKPGCVAWREWWLERWENLRKRYGKYLHK